MENEKRIYCFGEGKRDPMEKSNQDILHESKTFFAGWLPLNLELILRRFPLQKIGYEGQRTSAVEETKNCFAVLNFWNDFLGVLQSTLPVISLRAFPKYKNAQSEANCGCEWTCGT